MDFLVSWLIRKLCVYKNEYPHWQFYLYLSLDMSTVLTSMNDSRRFRNINSVWNFTGVCYCLCVRLVDLNFLPCGQKGACEALRCAAVETFLVNVAYMKCVSKSGFIRGT